MKMRFCGSIVQEKADVFLFYLLLSKLDFLKASIVFEDFI